MRVYFTSDLHGSDKCWLKFLATPKYYNADVIIVGGDITGKFLVPIIEQRDGSATTTFMGVKRRVRSAEERERLKTQIAYSGAYAFETTEEEYAEYERRPDLVDDLFRRLVLERVERWVALAETRLASQQVRCFVSGGNDDFFEVDDILRQSSVIEVPEGRVVELGHGIEMFGLGYANPTPWNCPRDIPEADLAAKIDALAGQVTRMDRAIFNIHVPPHDTGIDTAPMLDENMQLVLSPSGGLEMIPVGSTAVRDAIERYQPMLGLHGHIHESAGVRHLGRSTIVNPGSEYGEGILRGALIDFDRRGELGKVELVTG